LKLSSVILAAGQGKRMHSALPKVLHPVLGKPMILHALEIAAVLTDDLPVVVVGHGAGAVCQAIQGRASWVVQEKQLGTAHAVRQAEPQLRGKTDLVLVTSADMPLLTSHTLARLVETQKNQAGPLTIGTVTLADSHGFGRVVRAAKDGSVQAIVEEAQASPEILALRELNAGVYCIRSDWLWDTLERVPISPKGEYYITDLVELAVKDGLPVQGVSMGAEEAIGVNTRVHLAEAERVMRQRVNTAWMERGVTLIDPAATTIETDVVIGRDTLIWPNTYLRGHTHLGEACEVGPNAVLRDTRTGSRCSLPACYLDGVVLGDGVTLEPFSVLKDEARLGTNGGAENSLLELEKGD